MEALQQITLPNFPEYVRIYETNIRLKARKAENAFEKVPQGNNMH